MKPARNQTKYWFKIKSDVGRIFLNSNFALLLFLFSFVYLIARGIGFRILSHGTDSAGFLELVKMPFPNLSLSNSALASHGLGLMSTNGYSADEICQFVTNYEPTMVSHWSYHPYLMSILLGGMEKIPGTNSVFISTISIGMSYVFGFLVIYLFMLRKGIQQKKILLWIALIAICPPVFESLRGQIYFDRIFFGPGIGLVIGTIILKQDYKDNLGRRLIYFCLPLSVLISDRTTFSAALVLIIFPLSLAVSKRNILESIPFLARTIPFGLLAMTWYLTYANVINDPLYSTQANVLELLSLGNMQYTWNRLSGYQFSSLVTFVGTILLFIGMSTRNARSIPLLIIVLLPNLVVDVGGAQLNGYTTHYHQLYIPVLLSLATIGFVKTQEKVDQEFTLRKFLSKVTVTVSILATIGFWVLNSTYSNSVNTFVGKVTQAYGFFPGDSSVMAYLEKQLAPLGTEFSNHKIRSISTLESLMPFVVQSTSYVVSYFPAGVGKSDAVLVNYENNQKYPIVYPYGEPSQNVTAPVSKCVQAVLDQKYQRIYEIDRGSLKTVLYIRNEIK